MFPCNSCKGPKRLAGLTLSLILVLCCLPLTAFGQGGQKVVRKKPVNESTEKRLLIEKGLSQKGSPFCSLVGADALSGPTPPGRSGPPRSGGAVGPG